jgi:hypothetical protein
MANLAIKGHPARGKFDVKAFALQVELSPMWFPEVTFENSPQEVELKLVEK